MEKFIRFKGYYLVFTLYQGVLKSFPLNMHPVLGHTLVANPEITAYYANIDTEAVFPNWDNGSKLTASY